MLTNRLKPIMLSLIPSNQSAFISEQLITNNIMIAHELFHSIRHNTRERTKKMVVKLDISKVYDRVEWNYLETAIKAFGFNEQCRKSVMSCVSTVNYSILVNGKPSGSFKQSRGLRQGDDPPSPQLFLICAKRLHALINSVETT